VKSADLTNKLKSLALGKGATKVGIAPISALSEAPDSHHPEDLLPSAESLISIAVKISKSPILNLPRTRGEYRTVYDTANAKLNNLAAEIASFLEEQDYEAVPIPASRYDRERLAGDISHKHAAVAAGLGRFGLNNLVLTPEHGPYVRFATVLTNASLRPDKPLDADLCLGEKCMRCVRACPARALQKPKHNPAEGWRINKKKCYDYIHTVLDGEICGLCIKACPSGSRTRRRTRRRA